MRLSTVPTAKSQIYAILLSDLPHGNDRAARQVGLYEEKQTTRGDEKRRAHCGKFATVIEVRELARAERGREGSVRKEEE